ncbi:Hypothetical predicted protein [Mytilus galloprovincialis]|uniref:Uncharacterized protein n=1 Tax=Mytilus galloprovincialis TaxID=29158 RepID=A0A8B6GUJ1_MYTGA|nr:Hypothetical predicted protein [Mytilus galloprovincialis]
MKLKPTSLSVLFCTISQAFDNSGICETSSHAGCDHINGCVDVITTVDVNQDILSDFSIYLALGMGSIVINIVFFAMCAIHYKRKRHSNYIISNAAMSPIEDADIQEHAYDEIDENVLSVELTNEEAVLQQHDRCDVSTASGSSRDDIPGHGYLTPYQPVVHYPNAIYKNLPLNSDIPHSSGTSDCIVETYENTVVFY